MLKVFAIVSVGLFSAVYWGIGLLLNATMALWLLMFPPLQGSFNPLQTAAPVQLSGSVQQAQPSNLQGAINVQ